MTKSEIEHKTFTISRTNAWYIRRANTLIRDSVKVIAKELLPAITAYSGDARTFRLDRQTKLKAQEQNTQRVRDIMLTYMAQIKRSADKMNKLFGLTPADWEVEELAAKLQGDKTMTEYIDIQSARAVSEVEVYAALAVKNGYTIPEAEEVYFNDMDAPHRNRDIAELAFLGYLSLKRTDILRPRKGGISSAYKSLMRINEDYMMRTFSMANAYAWKGLYKYTVTAGDAGVCQVCQDNARMIFPADEFVVPAHNRCRCIEVPILDYNS